MKKFFLCFTLAIALFVFGATANRTAHASEYCDFAVKVCDAFEDAIGHRKSIVASGMRIGLAGCRKLQYEVCEAERTDNQAELDRLKDLMQNIQRKVS